MLLNGGTKTGPHTVLSSRQEMKLGLMTKDNPESVKT